MPRSVWLVAPAWRRYAVTRLALAQWASLADALAPSGLDVHTVIVADDANLDLAREYGAEAVELDNDHGLGRRFNAGFAHAADRGADLFVYLGSDNWLHPDAFAPVISGEAEGAVVSGLGIAFVDLASGRLQPCAYRSGLERRGRRHGIIPWIIPRETLAPVGFEPIPPGARSLLDHRLAESVAARWVFHDPHPLARVDFKSDVNLNPYERVAPPLADGVEADAWPALAEHYPAALVEIARRTHEEVTAHAWTAPEAQRSAPQRAPGLAPPPGLGPQRWPSPLAEGHEVPGGREGRLD